ncbi:type III secretion system inner membrane ring subunit SctD [Chlamydia gallinacea]|uniref:type III secretion system inner membrane ring subunit SctD n=1 Tax=Chlamydia gallinacea TaxID=1457153 RepID=UPI001C82BD85|nr:type III secretion system inner membrane ring subunit SctD [Chlamydia gallinacea]MBX6687219.1 type III secretion system inner membrane ring subunit SctD [Chlamydia gallinacea]
MGARLVIIKGPLSGVSFVLEEGTSWSLGKDATVNDIPLEDPQLADAQVVITKEQDAYHISNINLKFPVLVNGKAITNSTQLHNGDVFQFGSNEYSFFTHEFDTDDIVYDFSVSSESTTNVLAEPADNKKTVGEPIQENVKAAATSPSVGTSSTASNADQELADAFLASAKADRASNGTTQDKESASASSLSPEKAQSKPQSRDVKNNQTQNVTMEETGALPNQNQPLPNPDPETSPTQSQEGSLTPEGEPFAEGSSEHKASADQDAVDKQEADKESRAESSDNSEEFQSSQEDSQDKGQEESTGEQQEEATENEEADASAQSQTQGHKPDVLAPFNVQDLFRFDQGIFPAEIDEIAQKNVTVDLSQPSRFVLKVLAGANIGAEFHLDAGRSYILGSDPEAADIVFNDLSVSHQHAKIIVSSDGSAMLEDLGSKNGVIVEGRKIEHNSTLSSNQVVALGTTLFLLIDHLAPADTIVAAFAPEDYGLFGRPQDAEALAEQAAQEEEEKRRRATLPTGSFILTLFIGGLAILFGIGTASLFHTKEVVSIDHIDFQEDIERVVHAFPTVRYTFNKNNGQLFLIGHVKNSLDKSELLYKVDALSFIKSVDDNVIDDEAVWQEMNILLSKRPEFKGVSMHSPEPGQFVITGYLKTEEQAVCLSDYLNIHFNYLSLLENKVIIESQMLKSIVGHLLQAGFPNIQVACINGEVVLTGYVNNDDGEKFRVVVQEISSIPGVRLVKNFVVLLPAEEGIIDLNLRHPNRYRVTGYSKYGDVSINVVVNGRILTRGDVIDGMTITSIQPHCIFLEREGLKYKIEYNK